MEAGFTLEEEFHGKLTNLHYTSGKEIKGTGQVKALIG